MPECKPEWNREAITVFSILPSLVASTASHVTYYNLPYLAPFCASQIYVCTDLCSHMSHACVSHIHCRNLFFAHQSDVSRNVIVLDNLEEKLYASAQPPLNLAHLRIVVKTVAKFHAVSLCYKKTIFDSFVQHSEQVQASKNMDDVEIEGENIVLTGRMGLFDR